MMREVWTRCLWMILGVAVCVRVFGSDLRVSAEHHDVSNSDGPTLLVVFIDERLIATVTLDVYVVPGMKSTEADYSELSSLNEATWLAAIDWTLTDPQGYEVALPRPVLLRKAIRHRGPNAALASDRDSTVDRTTYQARLDFGLIPVGDFRLTTKLKGLKSSYPISVRTGEESDVRDTYLERQASRTTSYEEYRDLQLARYHNDPSHIEPVFMALDRALYGGPFKDAESLLAVCIEKIEARRKNAAPAQRRFFEDQSRELRGVQSALGDFFKHRDEWSLVRDMEKGSYVLKERISGRVIRDFTKAEQ